MSCFSPRSWLKSLQSAFGATRSRTAARLNLEPLEDRQLLAVFTVTNPSDDGLGTLRWAIGRANQTQELDTIRFSIGSGPRDIVPTRPLPRIVWPVILDGTTQPGYNGTPLITISGHLAGPVEGGLNLIFGDHRVRALTVRSFDGPGILVRGNGNVIEGCYIGIDPFQTFGAGNRGPGVLITTVGDVGEGPAVGNVVRGNVISGNGGSGVVIHGSQARNNVVGSGPGFAGNYIGTNANGTVAVRNEQNGVWVRNGASFNTIGGSSPNVIAGNGWSGVALTDGGVGNEVAGNFLGTNARGATGLGNGVGVWVGQGAGFNRIGMSLTGRPNIISGNRNEGVVLTDAGTSFNTVQGNFIGTNSVGTAAVPNLKDGVWIGNGARDNTIGGTAAGTGNIISGNTWSGVALFHRGTIRNAVQGNYIGTTVAGNAPLANGAGVWLAQEATSNVIGGTSPAARNVISANHQQGVMLRDPSTVSNMVQGNYIGTTAAGTAALGNGEGVRLALGASFNTVASNLISGSRGAGVALTDARTVRNTVQGNTIGTDASGSAPLGNFDGVTVTAGANGNYVGTAAIGGATSSPSTSVTVSYFETAAAVSTTCRAMLSPPTRTAA